MDATTPGNDPVPPRAGEPPASAVYAGPGAPPQYAPPPPQPAPPRRRTGWIVAAIVAGVLLLSLGGCCVALASIGGDGSGPSAITGDGVALIHIEGTIQDTGANPTGASPERLINMLRRAEDDPGIKAVLLRINSPGGTVSASQEIADEVARMKKPVIADIGDVGASGAYYIASQCDLIVATRNSAVGSIGVVMTLPNIEELMKKLGIKVTVIHEGTFKDAGSPFRSITPTETEMLKADLKPAYDQFIADVAKGRKLPEAKVREMATGWVWPGVVAKDMGLVDKLGNYADAVREAGRLGGIEGEPRVVDYDESDVFGLLGRFVESVERLSPVSASAELKGAVPR